MSPQASRLAGPSQPTNQRSTSVSTSVSTSISTSVSTVSHGASAAWPDRFAWPVWFARPACPGCSEGGLLLHRFGDPEVCYYRKYNGPGIQKCVTVANSTVQGFRSVLLWRIQRLRGPEVCSCRKLSGPRVQECVIVANSTIQGSRSV